MTWVVFTEGRLRQCRGEGENQDTNDGGSGMDGDSVLSVHRGIS